jgi:hypothetical protein
MWSWINTVLVLSMALYGLQLLRDLGAGPALLDHHIDDRFEMAIGPLHTPGNRGMWMAAIQVSMEEYHILPQRKCDESGLSRAEINRDPSRRQCRASIGGRG